MTHVFLQAKKAFYIPCNILSSMSTMHKLSTHRRTCKLLSQEGPFDDTEIPLWKLYQSEHAKSITIVPLPNQRTPVTDALWDDFL